MSLFDHDAERKVIALALSGDHAARELLDALQPTTRTRRLLLAGKVPTLPEGIAELKRIEAELPVLVPMADLRRRLWLAYMRRTISRVAEHGSDRDVRRAWAVLMYQDESPSDAVDAASAEDYRRRK